MEKIEQHAREYIAYVWDVADSPEQAQKQLMKLLSTHTKQQCVGFAEWILRNGWKPFSVDTWRQRNVGSAYTTAQLYEQYLKEVEL